MIDISSALGEGIGFESNTVNFKKMYFNFSELPKLYQGMSITWRSSVVYFISDDRYPQQPGIRARNWF